MGWSLLPDTLRPFKIHFFGNEYFGNTMSVLMFKNVLQNSVPTEIKLRNVTFCLPLPKRQILK